MGGVILNDVRTKPYWSGPTIYIAGRWYSGEQVPVLNKYSGEVMGTVRDVTEDEVNQAVASAEQSFRQNPLTPFERFEILRDMSDWILKHEEEIIQLVISEVGKTFRDTKLEVNRACQTFLISAEEAKRISGETLPVFSISGVESKMAFSMRVPKGIIGAITSFNYPFLLAAHKIAPAIAGGNTVVIKPAPNTPFSTAKMLQGLHECGLPKDHVQLIQGGATTGTAMLKNPVINMYTFTGSSTIGEKIKTETGLRPVVLGLGNPSPNIVCADADLDKAARLCGQRAFTAAGQTSASVQRILVDQSCWSIFVDKLIKTVKSLNVGDPYDPETDVGPMISEREACRAESWVDEAIESGARVLCGRRREKSFFYPTLLTNVNPEERIFREEIFAPVAVVIPFSNLNEAIELANCTNYGLNAAIFTKSTENATFAWKKLDFGGVIVNDTSTFRSELVPYGGVKNSGMGREGPRYAIEEMTNVKVLVLNL